MTPLKDRILSLIRRAGPTGISGDDLFAIVFDGQLPRYRGGHAGRDETRQRATLKANIHQLNKTLAVTGWRIRGERCPGGHYRLVKTTPIYDAERDTWLGVAQAYELIRQRVRDGGKGWSP